MPADESADVGFALPHRIVDDMDLEPWDRSVGLYEEVRELACRVSLQHLPTTKPDVESLVTRSRHSLERLAEDER